jgi:hypothetical protein
LPKAENSTETPANTFSQQLDSSVNQKVRTNEKQTVRQSSTPKITTSRKDSPTVPRPVKKKSRSGEVKIIPN